MSQILLSAGEQGVNGGAKRKVGRQRRKVIPFIAVVRGSVDYFRSLPNFLRSRSTADRSWVSQYL